MIEWIEDWYLSNCDGDWEHSCGIKIGTLDNSGCIILINLSGTNLEDINFDIVDIERSADDWVYCKIEESLFKGAGGPKNLKEIIGVFSNWVTEKEIKSSARIE